MFVSDRFADGVYVVLIVSLVLGYIRWKNVSYIIVYPINKTGILYIFGEPYSSTVKYTIYKFGSNIFSFHLFIYFNCNYVKSNTLTNTYYEIRPDRAACLSVGPSSCLDFKFNRFTCYILL